MNLQSSNQKRRALTLFEVLLVITLVVLLAMVLLQELTPTDRKAMRITCVNNIKQIGLGYRVWEGDHDDKFPSFESVTNGGIMELVNSGGQAVVLNYLAMSNELSTPKILVCPDDTKVTMVSTFDQLTTSNISYFINLDASDDYPQMLLSGDDNLLVNGSPASHGNLALPTNAVTTWSKYRHNGSGNIGLADGSAQEVKSMDLTSFFNSSGAFTNRIIIP